MNTRRNQQAQRIGEQMALAPIDLLAAVEAPFWSTSNTTLGALGVDHTASCLDVLPPFDFDPNPPAQRVVDLHQNAFLGPLLDVVMDRTLGRKRARQQFPLAPALQLVEQAVDHCSQVYPPLRSGLGLHLDIRADHLPLLIGQVGRVALRVDSGVRQCYHLGTPPGQTVGLSNLSLPPVRGVYCMRTPGLCPYSRSLPPLFEYWRASQTIIGFLDKLRSVIENDRARFIRYYRYAFETIANYLLTINSAKEEKEILRTMYDDIRSAHFNTLYKHISIMADGRENAV